MNTEANDRISQTGSVVPAVLIIATIAVTVMLNSSVRRQFAQSFGKIETARVEQNDNAGVRFSWDVRSAVSVAAATSDQRNYAAGRQH